MATRFFVLILLSSFTILQVTAAGERDQDEEFVRTIDRTSLGPDGQQKLSHFRVYWHELYAGPNPNPTAMTIVPSPVSNSITGFGQVSITDDPLTDGPVLASSKLVGRAQGFYVEASQEQAAVLDAMNFVFLEGKYNGSTLTILGRNYIFDKVREMPIVGGSGLFRLARGYVLASTYSFNITARIAVVEYNVYVLHYG